MAKNRQQNPDNQANSEEKPEKQTAFWSSLPGIMTALGGIIVAVTGLLTALYTTGVIGSKGNSNAAPPLNTAVSLSAPAASPSNADNDRYKSLTGQWEVIEKPQQIYSDAKSVTWLYEATVSGNLLTLKGKIQAIDKNRVLSADDRLYEVNIVIKLEGLSGKKGQYTQTNPDGGTYGSDVDITLNADLTEFEGEVEDDEGNTYRLKGRKL